MTDNTDSSKAEEAFVAGFRAARRRGNSDVELNPISERTARSLFENWSGANE